MLGQVFEFSDLPRVAGLAFIEIALSADNAIVLGLLTHSLPSRLRLKALYIGLISAIFLRAGALCLVSLILHSPWLEVLGALYLLYLALRHFIKKQNARQPKSQVSFWKIVFLIEFFDLAFAIDSIVAGVAFIASPYSTNALSQRIHPKLWIVYFGGMLGVVAIRYAADLFSKMMRRFRNLENSAYLIIAWIAIKLLLHAMAPELPGFETLFWAVFICLFAAGFLKRKR